MTCKPSLLSRNELVYMHNVYDLIYKVNLNLWLLFSLFLLSSKPFFSNPIIWPKVQKGLLLGAVLNEARFTFYKVTPVLKMEISLNPDFSLLTN